MTKYTFISEYHGGTYIQQVTESSLENAIIKWAKNIKNEILSFEVADLNVLSRELKDESPVRINNMDNVWCLYFTLNKYPLLVNIVATL